VALQLQASFFSQVRESHGLIFMLDSDSEGDPGGVENHKSLWKRGIGWIRKKSSHGVTGTGTESEMTMSRMQVRHKAVDRLANSIPSILPN